MPDGSSKDVKEDKAPTAWVAEPAQSESGGSTEKLTNYAAASYRTRLGMLPRINRAPAPYSSTSRSPRYRRKSRSKVTSPAPCSIASAAK